MTYNKPKVVVMKAASVIQSSGNVKGPYTHADAKPLMTKFTITAYEADE